jgi:hypothetical protein
MEKGSQYGERARRQRCGCASSRWLRRATLGAGWSEYGLAGAWRTNEQNVVHAGTRHFQGALGGLLPVEIAHIDGILGRLGKHQLHIHADRLERLWRIDRVDDLPMACRRSAPCIRLNPAPSADRRRSLLCERQPGGEGLAPQIQQRRGHPWDYLGHSQKKMPRPLRGRGGEGGTSVQAGL